MVWKVSVLRVCVHVVARNLRVYILLVPCVGAKSVTESDGCLLLCPPRARALTTFSLSIVHHLAELDPAPAQCSSQWLSLLPDSIAVKV
jgi:hypothetical protein